MRWVEEKGTDGVTAKDFAELIYGKFGATKYGKFGATKYRIEKCRQMLNKLADDREYEMRYYEGSYRDHVPSTWVAA